MITENNKEKKLPTPEKIKGIETQGDYEDFTQKLVDPKIKEALKAATEGPLDIGYPKDAQTYDQAVAAAIKDFDIEATKINGTPLPGLKKIVDQYAPSTVDKPSGLEIASQRKMPETTRKAPDKLEGVLKITSPLDKIKAIMTLTEKDKDGVEKYILKTKLGYIRSEMINKPNARLVDLFAVLNWTNLNKDNPLYGDDVEKLQGEALTRLLNLLETSPDPRKWDEDLKKLSKTQGEKLSRYIQVKLNSIPALAKKTGGELINKEDFINMKVTDERNNLVHIQFKLQEFLDKLAS